MYKPLHHCADSKTLLLNHVKIHFLRLYTTCCSSSICGRAYSLSNGFLVFVGIGTRIAVAYQSEVSPLNLNFSLVGNRNCLVKLFNSQHMIVEFLSIFSSTTCSQTLTLHLVSLDCFRNGILITTLVFQFCR